MISVRRTNGLPQASFRFHLTVDTLAMLAMCFPLTGALRTFTFKNNVRAGRTELPRLIEVGASCFFDSGYCHTANWQFSQNLRKRLRSARSGPTILLLLCCQQAHTFGSDIYCSVGIPVMNRTTVRAYPFPYAEIPDFWIPAATAMADLA